MPVVCEFFRTFADKSLARRREYQECIADMLKDG